MFKIPIKLILLFFGLILVFTTTINAEDIQNVCTNYKFEENLQKGSRGQDVLVLQKILNSDKRTEIAKTGPGSKGFETKIFGEKTKLALKKFQALFIEYTLLADGVFQGKTKDLFNNLCAKKNNTTIGNFFSSTTISTSSLEDEDSSFSDFLDQLPRAQAIEPKYVIEKYFKKLLHTLYPPQPIDLNNASTTARLTQVLGMLALDNHSH
jgi:hypothetical protein